MPNKVRFALWGAEESNLVGSTYYVNNLPQAERDKIALYLNFDMIGSPNHVFFIYDGDNSDGVGARAGPTGSDAIEKTFETYYTWKDLPFKGTDFSGRSDYGPFIAAGVDIPSGGLFTGAEGIKTAEEVTLWGGTAGQQYDPCYHLACDTSRTSTWRRSTSTSTQLHLRRSRSPTPPRRSMVFLASPCRARNRWASRSETTDMTDQYVGQVGERVPPLSSPWPSPLFVLHHAADRQHVSHGRYCIGAW